MAGIYIHIPFCKQACHYCDFHFSTSLAHRDVFLRALIKEIELQKDFLGQRSVESIYFGGGTPSLMPSRDLSEIFDKLNQYFKISKTAEITLEANPDDLDKTKVEALKSTPINRFSIGIQSFFEEDLQWMNRAHTASQADSALKRVQDAGYENITCDLIYGYPLLTNSKLKFNIEQLTSNQVPHISAYAMTVEDRTALAAFIRTEKQPPMDERQSAEQLIQLIEALEIANYEQYEISNFARENRYSRHNTNYWMGIPYLGLGPSAHSYNGQIRSWNVAQNHTYINAILTEEKIPSESENLSERDRFNEYIMTSLRTKWGMDLSRFADPKFSGDIQETKRMLQSFIQSEEIYQDGEVYYLTRKGKLFADRIASTLFQLE